MPLLTATCLTSAVQLARSILAITHTRRPRKSCSVESLHPGVFHSFMVQRECMRLPCKQRLCPSSPGSSSNRCSISPESARLPPITLHASRANAKRCLPQVNLTGAFLLSEAIVPLMPKGQGSIVHISSTRAHQSEPHSEVTFSGPTEVQLSTAHSKQRVRCMQCAYAVAEAHARAHAHAHAPACTCTCTCLSHSQVVGPARQLPPFSIITAVCSGLISPQRDSRQQGNRDPKSSTPQRWTLPAFAW